MGSRTANYVDYQQRVKEFSVGDKVYRVLSGKDFNVGTVMAVWPAIGMVDVEWPYGSERIPVEDVARTEANDLPPEVGHDNIPGGAAEVSKPGGPEKVPSMESSRKVASDPDSIRRVAEAYVKKALYWASKDRHYRASGAEIAANSFQCPKCKKVHLRAAFYKRSEGHSEHLLGCPGCLFLIKKCDIVGHPDYVDDVAEAKKPFARIRLGDQA